MDEAAVTRGVPRRLKDAQVSSPSTVRERPELPVEGDPRLIRGPGPDGGAIGSRHGLSQSAGMVRMVVRQDNVGDIAPFGADPLQPSIDRVGTARHARVDEDHADGVGYQEAAHVEVE